MGLLGFALCIVGIMVAPEDRRSRVAVGLLILGFILMANSGWRPFT